MPFSEKGDVGIRDEEAGKGFPLKQPEELKQRTINRVRKFLREHRSAA